MTESEKALNDIYDMVSTILSTLDDLSQKVDDRDANISGQLEEIRSELYQLRTGEDD